jgi:2-oxoglutarate dehydrogenase E2 component (dihydrolipoamide succinyltransferase)
MLNILFLGLDFTWNANLVFFQGLVVPVIRDADTMNFADIEKGINNLAKKATEGALSIDEMAGGTFTISNGGVYGSLISTPIINPPQVLLLFFSGAAL